MTWADVALWVGAWILLDVAWEWFRYHSDAYWTVRAFFLKRWLRLWCLWHGHKWRQYRSVQSWNRCDVCGRVR